ncbi:hypothetical protein [Streptosporangium sp. NPDC051022]|uniref:hypothetical protein n=1 Tax=Streptosporangium sp. NPDC051022 TaxID=3155752 RepID=UPI003429E0B1
MHLRKHAAALSVTLLTAATLLVTAAPAHAQPTNCRSGKENITGSGFDFWYICTGGDGGYALQYRVKHPNPQVDTWIYGYSTSCVPVGQFLDFHQTWGQREATGVVYC